MERSPRRSVGRLSRARNYSQFRVNESKTIRIAAQTRAPERERKRRGRHEERSKTRAQRDEGEDDHEGARESEVSRRTFILRYPRPMSPFRFLLPPPLPGFDPGGTPGHTPRILRGPQARFLNFVTFKFKHSHLLRSPPPQCLCLLPVPILSLPSHGPLSVTPFLSLLSYSIARLLRPFFRFIIRMRASNSPPEHFFSAVQQKHERAHVSTLSSRNRTI